MYVQFEGKRYALKSDPSVVVDNFIAPRFDHVCNVTEENGNETIAIYRSRDGELAYGRLWTASNYGSFGVLSRYETVMREV